MSGRARAYVDVTWFYDRGGRREGRRQAGQAGKLLRRRLSKQSDHWSFSKVLEERTQKVFIIAKQADWRTCWWMKRRRRLRKGRG